MKIASFDVGIKNLAVCIIDHSSEDLSNTIIDWKVIKLVDDDKKVNKGVNIQEMADRLYVILEEELADKWGGQIDHVLIENQPVMKNPLMKTVQMLIFGFFQGARVMGRIGNIHFMSARSKLNVSGVVRVSHLKSPYQNTKQSSIMTAKEYLKGDSEADRKSVV